MRLDRIQIWIVATIAGALTLLAPQILPWAHLLYFAPLLVTLFYQRSLAACLWWAVCCGLLVDLLSSDGRLGLYALNYSGTALLLYGQRRNFFADSLSTLPLMTFFFAAISSLFEIILVRLLHTSPLLSSTGAATHLLLMPALDACYAFLLFTLPALLFGKRQRTGKEYFSR